MIFDPAALEKVVNDTLNNYDVPAGHKGAFVTVANGDGVQAVIATRLNDTWQVQTNVGFTHDHGVEYGGSVKATW